jgi:hypothetical protein
MRVQGPESNEIEQSYWLRAINWTHSLYMRVQHQKWQIKAKGMAPFWRENNWFRSKNELMNWRTKMQAGSTKAGSKLKDSICFK